MTQVEINPSDWESMISLMNRANEFNDILFGKNEDGESTSITICEDEIITRTLQRNKWTRINIYHRDGCCEELFER